MLKALGMEGSVVVDAELSKSIETHESIAGIV